MHIQTGRDVSRLMNRLNLARIAARRKRMRRCNTVTCHSGHGIGYTSGAAQLKYSKNCALSDKSTKLGRHVYQYITNISGYLAITGLAPDGRSSHITKWPLTGDIFVQNHWWRRVK